MKVQVLSSVMNKNANDIVLHMNLESDAVIINQCDSFSCEEFEYKGRNVKFLSFPDRGIGRSRNEAILRADRDICLFSDEDIVYKDGYEKLIIAEFEKNKKADMILFNIDIDENRRTYNITQRKRVRWYNCGRYGAVSFAVRRESLLASKVMFSLLFGGGAKYSNGEDSLFLKEFMKTGRKVYTAPVTIGREEASESSWFKGYNEKFFHDRGVLYYFLYGKMDVLFSLRFLMAHRKSLCKDYSLSQCFKWMREGIKEGKKLGRGGADGK